MDQPLVSIVIPCYNGEVHLMECLQSVIGQTYLHCEIIVIDDGSTDNSLEIIKSLGENIRYQTGANQGACAARNNGLELATGKYVKFFDADDVMMQDAIATQVEMAETLEPHQFVYGNLLDLDTKETVFDELRTSKETTRDEMIYQAFCHDIITGSPLHNRQFLIEHNLRFDDKLLDGQEWDFHIMIAIAGGIFVYQPAIIYHYRLHDGPDRISQMLKDPTTKVQRRWTKLSNACQKIIDTYQGETMPSPIKAKILRRLCKAEARFFSLKLKDKIEEARHLRRQLNSPLQMSLSYIRYIPRRYFTKKI